ncbi:MAG: hypothetical protein ACRC8Z_09220 [Empedobacter falsenii]
MNATANRGLVRAGAGTTANEYTLGLISGTANGQVMTWNGSSWNPVSPANSLNIFNTNGTLTGDRTVDFGTYTNLVFKKGSQAHGFTYDQNHTGFNMYGNITSSIGLISNINSNGRESILKLLHDNTRSVIRANSDEGLKIATEFLKDIIFNSYENSEGGGYERNNLTIKANGNIGVSTTTPTAKLHIVGNASDLTPVIITSLRTYADNAAATSAGLPVGALYRKADGTLMVRY